MVLFWASMLIAQAGAFIFFKDLADISQWLVQSNRKFTMAIWYNRYPIAAVSIAALLIALFAWWRQPDVCHGALLGVLVFIFVLNFVSGMFNPKWMFRSQQHKARFVSVAEAPQYMQSSLRFAHFGPDSYASVDDINVLVLQTDHGAYAYSDYYLLQPHVVKGDTIGVEEVIMTYCGLTNLGIAYSPVIEEQKLDLTVMTQLKNNLVLWDKNGGMRDVREGAKRDVVFHLTVGTYENALGGDPVGGNLLEAQRRFAAALKARGYVVEARGVPEGHSWGLWRADLGRALKYLLGPNPEKPYEAGGEPR